MSDASCDVAVVIPAFNAQAFLEEAIKSVLDQTVPPRAIIVVDDGSEDATSTIARSYGDLVRCVRQPNSGVSAARNRGVVEATATYVAFLDADDVWLPPKLEEQMALHQEDPSLGLTYTSWRIANTDLDPIGRPQWAPPEEALRNTLTLEPPGIWISTTAMIPRQVFHRVGGFDTELSTSADADLALRVGVRHPVAGVDRPLALYRQHSSQMHLNADVMERDMNIVYRKFFNDPAVPERLRVLEGRARANLHHTLALHRRQEGRRGEAVRHLGLALKHDPVRTVSHSASLALRRLRHG